MMENINVIITILTITILVGVSTIPVLYSKYSPSVVVKRRNTNEFSSMFTPVENYLFRHTLRPLIGSFECEVCEIVVGGLKDLATRKSTQNDVVFFAKKMCVLFKLEDDSICKQVTEEFKDELFAVATRVTLPAKDVCSILYGNKCGPENPALMWNVTLPSTPKPPVLPPKPPKSGSPVLRVLHLTDVHLDPGYKAGTETDCGEPLCCRSADGKPAPDHEAAGKYGSLGACDIPRLTVENLFQHLSTIQDKFDYVYFTGDIPPHDIWMQSRSDQVQALRTYTEIIKKYLPNKNVYNTIGNHESAPVNSFPPDYVTGNLSMSWLYSELAKSWGNWLPADTQETILKSASYTMSPHPGFRIISLNMNFCNNMNWWLLINITDPNGELQWLIQTLQYAEDHREKVHILGHISPGSEDCLKAWSWNYYKIANRYESTIAGQFFGHTHRNYYQMQYDEKTLTRPVGVVYMPGSITTYTHLNPGYRIYEIDGFYDKSSWMVQDYQNYYLNLTEANVKNKLDWKLEYSAKEEFGLKHLFPSDWDDLIKRMDTDDKLFQTFYRHVSKSAGASPCTGACKNDMLCKLKTGRSGDPSLC